MGRVPNTYIKLTEKTASVVGSCKHLSVNHMAAGSMLPKSIEFSPTFQTHPTYIANIFKQAVSYKPSALVLL